MSLSPRLGIGDVVAADLPIPTGQICPGKPIACFKHGAGRQLS